MAGGAPHMVVAPAQEPKPGCRSSGDSSDVTVLVEHTEADEDLALDTVVRHDTNVEITTQRTQIASHGQVDEREPDQYR